MLNVTGWLQRAEDWLMAEVTHVQRIKTLLLETHEYYGQRLMPRQIHMMAEELSPFSAEEVSLALRRWRLMPPAAGHKPRPPMPNEIIAILAPQMTQDQEANSIAAHILSCISSCGYTQPKRAQEQLGETAWQVVRDRGGWHNLCSTVTIEQLPTLHAQLRDCAKGRLQGRPLRELDLHPALSAASAPRLVGEIPGYTRHESMSSLGDVVDACLTPHQERP